MQNNVNKDVALLSEGHSDPTSLTSKGPYSSFYDDPKLMAMMSYHVMDHHRQHSVPGSNGLHIRFLSLLALRAEEIMSLSWVRHKSRSWIY